ncbi:MAG: hypothetical protein WC426_02550 [Sulfuriferula sp.]
MYTNQKMSEGIPLLASINPVSQGVGSISSGWISAANLHQIMAIISTGVLGASATVDAKVQQATSNAGAGAKDVTGKAITQIVKATGDNKQALINLRADDLDSANGFTFVAITLTVGVAASQVAAYLLGNPRFQPAEAYNNASVAQVV